MSIKVEEPRKVKRYLEYNVLQGARERILEMLYSFDELIVSFSGGKDSLALLHLVLQTYEQEGVSKPLRVHFRDEELIPDDVVDFVNTYRTDPRLDFKYFCLQLESEKMILGRKLPYIQWDKNRQHIRPMPEWAITSDQVFNQYNANEFEVNYARQSGYVSNQKKNTMSTSGIYINQVQLYEFALLHPLMKRERVDTSFRQETSYLALFAADDDSRILGVVGWLGIKNSIRYKSDFVHPNWRGNGLYKMLWAAREEKVLNLATSNYKWLTAYCTKMSLPMYLKHGFQIQHQSEAGITFVKKQIPT